MKHLISNFRFPISGFFVFLFSFFLFPFSSFSCECPPLTELNADALNKYNAVFYGKVDSVSACAATGLATAYFSITELYKGDLPANVKVDFDCSTECMMSFTNGEQWLVYANSQHYGSLRAEICSHSRKFFSDPQQDIYLMSTKRSFEDEKALLVKLLGIHVPASTDGKINSQELQHKNEQPDAMSKLWLLGISFLVMVIIYFVSRKMKP